MITRFALARQPWCDARIVVLALAGLTACSFGGDDPTLALGNDCGSSADCGEGVCDEGVCVDPSSTRGQIVVEVLRGPNDTERLAPASWAFELGTLTGGGISDILLPETRQVAGSVRWKGVRVPAKVRFARRMPSALQVLSPVAVETDTFRGATPDEGASDVDYQVVLVGGETYDVTVTPSMDTFDAAEQIAPAIRSLPPIFATVEIDAASDAAPFRFDVSFPDTLDAECGEAELTGCTLTGRILTFDGFSVSPGVGLQVRALEKDSGRVVSSIGETDAFGDYAIRVSDTAGPYVVRITAPGANAEPFPSVSIDPELAFVGDPVERRVFVPRVAPILFSGTVQDEQLRPVQGATVRFASTVVFQETELGLEGSFAASATTASDGAYSLQLLPGSYEVAITPPDDSVNRWAPLAAQAVVVEGLPGGGDGGSVVLPSQVTLSGSCTTFTGEPASGVTVAARARRELGGLQRSRETVSSMDGRFEMSVDAGLYDVLIKVPDSTGFPWLIEPELAVPPRSGTITRAWELPPPIVVRGKVVSAAGTVVDDATIRAYVFENGDTLRPVQVAETKSDEEGSYQLLISPTLGG